MDLIVSLLAVGFSRQIRHQISSFRLHHEWAQLPLEATAHFAIDDSSQSGFSSSSIGELECPDDESTDVVPPRKRRAFYVHKIQNSLQPKVRSSKAYKLVSFKLLHRPIWPCRSTL